MRVFVTGATGFIGSAVVQELLKAGHRVLGLARSDAAAQSLAAAGAEFHRGDLEDLESLKAGAAASDGVIHTGFIHDFARFKEVCAVDQRAIEALGSVLVGSSRRMVVTSGTALVNPGHLATEDMVAPFNPAAPRASEAAADALALRGVRVSVVRPSPSVHGDGDHGFVPALIGMARAKGVSAYIGEGLNRWTAVHRFDLARLYRLALENSTAGARFHGVAEQEIPFKEIATTIGKHLNLPVVSKAAGDEAAQHFTWFTHFAAVDCPASSQLTQQRLGWSPTNLTLLADLDQGSYFKN